MKSIILFGIKHCGKSTQARLLGKHFGCKTFDTDDLVTEMTGKTPRQIYNESGKDAFLEAESKACGELVQKLGNEFAVIATGGGICNNQGALDELRKIGTFVFLNSDEETALGRIIKEIEIYEDGTMKNLPAYIAKENPSTIDDVKRIFHGFYEERQKIYHEICDITVNMRPVSKPENMELILKALGVS